MIGWPNPTCKSARFGCRSTPHSVVNQYDPLRQQAYITCNILSPDFNDMLGIRELRGIKNKMKCGIRWRAGISDRNVRASDVRRSRSYQHIVYIQIAMGRRNTVESPAIDRDLPRNRRSTHRGAVDVAERRRDIYEWPKTAIYVVGFPLHRRVIPLQEKGVELHG